VLKRNLDQPWTHPWTAPQEELWIALSAMGLFYKGLGILPSLSSKANKFSLQLGV
jgi:antirestriction protein ArdC